MVHEIDSGLIIPVKPEFGNPEQIALCRGRTRYWEFETEKGPFILKMNSWNYWFNPFGIYCLLRELELANAGLKFSF